jgi:hypothetical protein
MDCAQLRGLLEGLVTALKVQEPAVGKSRH